VHMASNVIYETILTDFNLPRVAAMAALFLVLALSCLGVLGFLQKRSTDLWTGERSGATP
jgi:hypothetical protein